MSPTCTSHEELRNMPELEISRPSGYRPSMALYAIQPRQRHHHTVRQHLHSSPSDATTSPVHSNPISETTAVAYDKVLYDIHHQHCQTLVVLYEVVPIEYLPGVWSLADTTAA